MNYTLLDTEELVYLAIKASKEGRSAEALAFLKQSLLNAPENSEALYLLAMEHASLGMLERAINEMNQLVIHNEELHIARFQLGFLFNLVNATDEANKAWAPLKTLGEDNALNLFIYGLQKLNNDDTVAAQNCFEEGLKSNRDYLSLNDQMVGILQELEEDENQTTDEQGSFAKMPINNLYLSKYSSSEN